jgi:geranylgeranyl diphosphate synthase type I
MAHTLAGTTANGREQVDQLLGRPDLSTDQVEDLRTIITESGAVDAVESEITRLADNARAALARATEVEAEARGVLADLVDVSTARSA